MTMERVGRQVLPGTGANFSRVKRTSSGQNGRCRFEEMVEKVKGRASAEACVVCVRSEV